MQSENSTPAPGFNPLEYNVVGLAKEMPDEMASNVLRLVQEYSFMEVPISASSSEAETQQRLKETHEGFANRRQEIRGELSELISEFVQSSSDNTEILERYKRKPA